MHKKAVEVGMKVVVSNCADIAASENIAHLIGKEATVIRQVGSADFLVGCGSGTYILSPRHFEPANPARRVVRLLDSPPSGRTNNE